MGRPFLAFCGGDLLPRYCPWCGHELGVNELKLTIGCATTYTIRRDSRPVEVVSEEKRKALEKEERDRKSREKDREGWNRRG